MDALVFVQGDIVVEQSVVTNVSLRIPWSKKTTNHCTQVEGCSFSQYTKKLA